MVLRAAQAGHRRHQVHRGEISRARAFHDPLGGRHPAQGVQGAASLVRQGRDAGLPMTAAFAQRGPRIGPNLSDTRSMSANNAGRNSLTLAIGTYWSRRIRTMKNAIVFSLSESEPLRYSVFV